MSLTVVKGLQSEIFVPITPSLKIPVTKELKDIVHRSCNSSRCSQEEPERFQTLLVTGQGERSKTLTSHLVIWMVSKYLVDMITVMLM